MKFLKIITLNFLLLISIIGSLVFLMVIVSEALRFTKSKFLYKNIECIRASCNEAYENISWAKEHFKEYGEISFHYETPVVWRADSFKGNTINILKDNFTRKTLSENKIPDNAKIAYFFGGSVVWGFGSNDENTIASHFQNISGFKTFNYGESAWTSDQSLMYLIKTIKQGHKPDYVIFINGINDGLKCYNKNKDEFGLLKEDELIITLGETIRSKSNVTFQNFFSIPVELIGRLKSLFKTNVSKTDLGLKSDCMKSNYHKKIMQNLSNNWKIANNLVQNNNGKFFAIIEPQLAFTDTKIDERIDFKIDSDSTKENIEMYSHLKIITKDLDYVYDYSSIYNGINDYIFIDSGSHVTPFGNKFLAETIYNEIIKGKF